MQSPCFDLFSIGSSSQNLLRQGKKLMRFLIAGVVADKVLSPTKRRSRVVKPSPTLEIVLNVRTYGRRGVPGDDCRQARKLAQPSFFRTSSVKGAVA